MIAAKYIHTLRLLKLMYIKFVEFLAARDAFYGMKSSVLRHAMSFLVTQDVVRIVFKIATVSNISGLFDGRCETEMTSSGLMMSTCEQVKTTRTVVVWGYDAI
tara:strand:- start:123 stop:431 length:309 start_codon:yes stop_codon:yes gene_type:complete